MPPISVVFVITGLAAWMNGLYFLGIGSDREEGGPDPLVSVGWVSVVAGLVDLGSALWFVGQADGPHVLAGLVTFYGIFFVALGVTEIVGLDLRQVGNLAVPVAIVPLFWWDFLAGTWMLQSILIVWAVAFLAITATTYGKLAAKQLGVILLGVATYAFWLPVVIMALGNDIP
ncbi:MAG: hypothetical protein OEU32_04930 [Acidimicrobiia bacterium]|nr:hypothetical protein [Acidimicrobiia bacterium]